MEIKPLQKVFKWKACYSDRVFLQFLIHLFLKKTISVKLEA